MATRFSASDARKKTELAKQRIEAEKKAASETKKELAKKRQAINIGWEKQRLDILLAAIDGKHELKIKSSVYSFRRLVDLGLKVVEKGLVRYQFNGRDAQADKARLETLHKEILEAFNAFMDASKDDLSEYYGNFSIYYQTLHEELYETINSYFSSDFFGDDVMFNEVPEKVSNHYSSHFSIISDRIKAFKDFKQIVDFDMEDEDEVDIDVLVNSEYVFSESDKPAAILNPSKAGNSLRIVWSADLGATHMNDPLFSDDGLAWLAATVGQEFLASVFKSLSLAAEEGKTETTLSFELVHDGWLFKKNRGETIYSCMPDEVVELVALEGFNVADTDSTDTGYKIFVTW